ncbi:MAG: hypothetical protein FWF59_09630 [Turicibacter sp.]|nr:hypothetical protein [Turicibacter sp.]
MGNSKEINAMGLFMEAWGEAVKRGDYEATGEVCDCGRNMKAYEVRQSQWGKCARCEAVREMKC